MAAALDCTLAIVAEMSNSATLIGLFRLPAEWRRGWTVVSVPCLLPAKSLSIEATRTARFRDIPQWNFYIAAVGRTIRELARIGRGWRTGMARRSKSGGGHILNLSEEVVLLGPAYLDRHLLASR
jgi:hypothetical protein